ncbi:hypothetical protein CVD28_00245 [Bacillus sp. M6-12]|uniref:RNA ligase family protein n=1 Tax=Bacillus sp. M6-12 TaxID=2054166 RepID=UPI000C75C31C|nr:RNA ligase family protein [Bacillus sp. M6-12]PLS18865.1 hypothetical protein CVD28_00245 [Bacillus sp. M6-12]
MNRKSVENPKFLEFEKMFPPFLRDMETGLCIPQIAEGWEWCFDPTQSYVLEKVDGENTKIVVSNGVYEVFARNQKTKGYVKVELGNPSYKYLMQGVANFIASRKKTLKDGVYFGEVLGENIQNNPYNLTSHLWYDFRPFKGGVEAYKDYPKTSNFEDWKEWVLSLQSLLNPEVEAEGVIFLNKEDGRMAKLRKDMFDLSYDKRTIAYAKAKKKNVSK